MTRVLLALVLIASSSSAGLIDLDGHDIDDFYFNVEGRLGVGWLSGRASADGRFFDGDKISYDDLGVDEDEWLLEGAATFRIRKVFQIRSRVFSRSWEGSERIDETFEYDDVAFTVSDEVEARLSVTAAAVDFEWLFLTEGEAKSVAVELGFGGGIRYLSARLRIENETTGFTGSRRATAGTLTAGVWGALTFLNVVRLEAAVSGFVIDYGSLRLVYLEAGLEGKFFLHRFVYVGAGLRITDLELERTRGRDFEVGLTLLNAYVAVGFQF
ncbi:MAG: hypothetical protein HUU15_18630 [Candidatus Brocadiae bacterium]|nr:hypothetical protein [Candidatus Brocadiia bacterium]